MAEVSRVHSIPNQFGRRDELSGAYIAGFVDGEGCFCVSFSKHQTSKRRLEVRPQFEIELRADDKPVLERIKKVLDCGEIYHLDYERYKWSPHVKYKVAKIDDLKNKIIPFFKKNPLQAKKSRSFKIWSQVVEMVYKKEHLSYGGFQKIIKLRDKIRQSGKKNYEPPGYGKTVRPVA